MHAVVNMKITCLQNSTLRQKCRSELFFWLPPNIAVTTTPVALTPKSRSAQFLEQPWRRQLRSSSQLFRKALIQNYCDSFSDILQFSHHRQLHHQNQQTPPMQAHRPQNFPHFYHIKVQIHSNLISTKSPVYGITQNSHHGGNLI